jgi:hypothetical protein
MTLNHLLALSWAINHAAETRGELTGHPDPEALTDFDEMVRIAREALEELMNRQVVQ